MHEKTQVEEINEIVDLLIGPRNALAQNTLLGGFLPRLDVSKPNIHDSKKEFLLEKEAVNSIVEHLDGVILQVLNRDEDADREEMLGRLGGVIDVGASNRLRSKKTETASDLALRNISETGFYYNSLFVVMEMISVYNERLVELKDQEKQFWSVSNRAPNYYARTIARRLARLYATEKRKRPTFGIAREGNHPSTDFGRALEQVFSVLGIKASVRNAAEWAIGQLTEEDINPPVNKLLSHGIKMGAPAYPPRQKDIKEEIVSALAKKGK